MSKERPASFQVDLNMQKTNFQQNYVTANSGVRNIELKTLANFS